MTSADFLLARIDDRLLHGQVAVGWAPTLKPSRIYIADDAAASTPWESTLFRSFPPPGADVEVVGLEAFAALWRRGHVEASRSFLLLRSPQAALRLVELGVPFARLNVGGLRHQEEAREVLSYVWLRPGDEEALRSLAARGVRLFARDLPMNPEHDLAALLAG